MNAQKAGAAVQIICQWLALLGCGYIMAAHNGIDIGVAVALAIYAVMPVAR